MLHQNRYSYITLHFKVFEYILYIFDDIYNSASQAMGYEPKFARKIIYHRSPYFQKRPTTSIMLHEF